MSSTITDLIALVVAGMVGGYVFGFAIKKQSGGTVKTLVAGAVGGVAGYSLQLFVPLPTLATAGGGYSVVEDSAFEHLFMMAMFGLTAGGTLALAWGLLLADSAKHRRH